MKNWTIGLDEVGRGSLAGPVVVAAAAITRNYRPDKSLGELRDSKELTSRQREAWVRHFEASPNVTFSLSWVNPRSIERINISNAANRAAEKAFRRVGREIGYLPETCRIYLDGGLYLGRKGRVPEAKTVVKADQKFNAVKVASILAKVYRDRRMVRFAGKYPGYGFDAHKGYATRQHRESLIKLGPSEIHRLTFLGKCLTISAKAANNLN